ncbi:unnamed protein product [Moneuplotes crassus]|uniref:Transmembrane protein 107 n=1 Tax=Euplotes crassus TaxID=5936 RepID=A0AAD1Y1C9_EUPCR|nr:unnamed protein product [Moneuplotes crassus]
MASNSIAHIVSPFKFMLLLMNIMLVISICHMRDEFIYSGLRVEYGSSSQEYKDADTQFIVCLTLFLVCNCLQLLIVFLGINLFLDVTNMILSFIHAAGVLSLYSYIMNSWTHGFMWNLFIPFGVFPLLLEGVMCFYSWSHFKID